MIHDHEANVVFREGGLDIGDLSRPEQGRGTRRGHGNDQSLAHVEIYSLGKARCFGQAVAGCV